MTVVVGYIPNARGAAALAAGIDEARLRVSRLVVVNATKADALVDPRFASEAAIGDLEKALSGLGLEFAVVQRIGDLAEQVLDVVRETDASLLVIGLRPRTAVGKALWGSVAQRLLLDCPCAVLAVKTTDVPRSSARAASS